MSKEKEPIRSRRQLRAQLAQTNGTTEKPAEPGPATPKTDDAAAAASGHAAGSNAEHATDATAPTVPVEPSTPPRVEARVEATPRERESQTRARDRAALRAYKELLDQSELNPLPSRRALRQAQLDADRAPITAVNPVVSAAAAPGAGTKPEQAPGTPPSPVTQPAPKVASAAKVAKVAKADTSATQAGATAAGSGQGTTKPEVADGAPATGTQATSPTPQGSHPAPQGLPRTRAGRRAAAKPVDETPATAAATSAPPHSAQSQVAQSHAAQPPPLPAVAPSAPAGAPGPSSQDSTKAADAEPDTDNVSGGNYSPLPGLAPGDSYYPVSAGPPTGAVPVATPTAEELKVLAAQRADTERAAVLTQRAQARERLAQESAKNRRTGAEPRPGTEPRPVSEPRPVADPTATNNLAMVTPLEFVNVPGTGRPMMRPPSTTHVPIVTRSTPQQAPGARKPLPRPEKKAAAPAKAPGGTAREGTGTAGRSSSELETQAQATVARANTVPNVSAERFDAALAARAVHRPGPGNRLLTGGRSSTLKRAEAMATGGHPTVAPAVGHPDQELADGAADVPVEVHRSQMPPMPADYAHGLEPLDAMTAGLGRTQRNRLLQWGSVIVGGAALAVAAILFITTLTR
ncbi:hypothetical protein [Arthrobacter sp. H35-D1]|uniref:hypothetical protein n=1 Tax=Arthrobacter sp. H35-D1 TaxID=3046202 RepID=UPI0024BA46B1|nr:hypothetical protein [Arthrobacter sp. H35-D1]MDJ0313944.1 hypothetical protein [Arthrobacter sp. H35-D1]